MADETRDHKEQEPVAPPPAAVEEGAEVDALDPELPIPRGEEVESVIEALLFATTTPLNLKRLSVLTNGVPEEEVVAALGGIKERYANARCGLMLMEIAGGWQVATRPEVADWVLRLHRHRRRTALSPSLLESLAIVAYKQPLTRAEIEAVRGVDCGSALRSLQDAGLVEVVGRKETIGKPPLYGTTEVFLKTFGLRELEDLPSMGELKKILQGQSEPKKEEPKREEEPTAESAVAPQTEESPAGAAPEAAPAEEQAASQPEEAPVAEAPDEGTAGDPSAEEKPPEATP